MIQLIVLLLLLYGMLLAYIMDEPQERKAEWMLPVWAVLNVIVVIMCYFKVKWFWILALCLAVWLVLQSVWGWENKNVTDYVILPVYALAVAVASWMCTTHTYHVPLPPTYGPLSSPPQNATDFFKQAYPQA
jgi:uncharacterized membrane-anchored protein YitT (DUF2179 family)